MSTRKSLPYKPVSDFLSKVKDIFQEELTDPPEGRTRPLDLSFGDDQELNELRIRIKSIFSSRPWQKTNCSTTECLDDKGFDPNLSNDLFDECYHMESPSIFNNDSLDLDAMDLYVSIGVNESGGSYIQINPIQVEEENPKDSLDIRQFGAAINESDVSDPYFTIIETEDETIASKNITSGQVDANDNIDNLSLDYCHHQLDQAFILEHGGAITGIEITYRGDANHNDANSTVSSTSCTSMMSMASDKLRSELLMFGYSNIGPILPITKKTYLVRLKKFRSENANSGGSSGLNPAVETCSVSKLLVETNTLTKLKESHILDGEMCEKFQNISSLTMNAIQNFTREGVSRTSFNYLLIDPRLTQNLPENYHNFGDQHCWEVYLKSIFYVGKGTRTRPFQHLYEAATKFENIKRSKTGLTRLNKKMKTILDIWSEGHGVISLQVFQNSLGVEALTREAAMIEAIGLEKLTNEKPGDFYGPAKGWPKDKRISLGVALLYRAFKIFLNEGERQLKPCDIKTRRK